MDVTMPQLGETVTEGTITKWFKAVGDEVALDEALFEVSTDKVDSEVPAPAAGVLTEIVVPEGETVEVGVRLAVIGTSTGAADPAAAPVVPAAPSASAPPSVAPASAAPSAPIGGLVTSPLVRKLIQERGLDASRIVGSGEGGRITRRDVEAAAPGQAGVVRPNPVAPVIPPLMPVGGGDERIPFDNIRRRTAEHMVRSKATSAHVSTSVEVDFEGVERVRRTHGAAFRAEEGFGLTFLPFIVRAFCDSVHTYPAVNASLDGDVLVVHHDINLGIAVDLDFAGLIAPVIRGVDTKRLRTVAREIHDLGTRARNKQLGPDEVMGGTFTVTNMGPFGTYMTIPIINQPQVGILATDAVRKRPVVVEGPDGEDCLAIHAVGVLTLTWDHRAFDGAYAASFLHAVGRVIEDRNWEAELA